MSEPILIGRDGWQPHTERNPFWLSSELGDPRPVEVMFEELIDGFRTQRVACLSKPFEQRGQLGNAKVVGWRFVTS